MAFFKAGSKFSTAVPSEDGKLDNPETKNLPTDSTAAFTAPKNNPLGSLNLRGLFVA